MIRALVTDLNGSFAAMEQHHNPELRDRPVAVCPVLADTGCVVASSREAKRFGVKCGVLVQDAMRMCPDLHIMQATPGLYVSYQERMRVLMESIVPVYDIPSIDEFRFRLIGDETRPARAREIAMEMKRVLRDEFSPCITMSAGIAPNFFLAKVATEVIKHDGLTVFTDDDLPEALNLFPKLTDLVGINVRMKVRLNAEGIFTVADLTASSMIRLQRVWGTVVGERWWHMLRGHDVEEVKTRPGSLGHSHVLPRDLRNREGVKAIALRLLGKAAARLRDRGYWACALGVSISGRQSWEHHQRIPETQDDRDLIALVTEWLDRAKYWSPLKVSVTFYDFRTRESFTPSLFVHDEEWGRPEPIQPPHEPSLFGLSLDKTNQEWGKHTIYLAAIHGVRHNAQEKIAFQKRELFSEGRGDDPIPWDRRPKISPLEELLVSAQKDEALGNLAAHLKGAGIGAGAEFSTWDPVEERAFAAIAEGLSATLSDRTFKLHRGELRRIVIRILRCVGYDAATADARADLVFLDVDRPAETEEPEPFADETVPETEFSY